MDLGWLQHSITNPSNLLDAKQQLAELKQRFPYVASLHIFDAKLEQLENGLDYQTKIKKAAIYSPNRSALYEYVIQPGIKKAIVDSEKMVSTNQSEAIATTAAHKNENTPQLSNKEKADKNALEKEILTHAISSSILKESEIVSAEIETSTPNSQPATKPAAVEQEKKTIDHSMNVIAWLSTEKEVSSPAKTEIQVEDKSLLIDKFIQQGEEKIHLPKEPESTFLEINRPQTEFFSPENMAKMSLAENEDFVTETLASIYAKQGNNKKAISAYEKLSLKFPEKSNYFARLIQELGNKH